MAEKYLNHPTTIDNIRFDSRLEAETYIQIKNACKTLQQLQPDTLYLVLPHTTLRLCDGQNNIGYKIPAITYRIDFLILKIDKAELKIVDFIFIESKGFCTKDFRLKLNLLLRSLTNLSDNAKYFLLVVAGSNLSTYRVIEKQNVEIVNVSCLYINFIDRFTPNNLEFLLSDENLKINDPFWTRLDAESSYYRKEISTIRDAFLYRIGL